MSYSTETVREFWALMRAGRPRSFLVRRLLQRMEKGEISEAEAARWLARDAAGTVPESSPTRRWPER